MLESGFHHLNHGSYGATLQVAQQAAERWRTAMDTCPSRFVEVRCKTRPCAAAVHRKLRRPSHCQARCCS